MWHIVYKYINILMCVNCVINRKEYTEGHLDLATSRCLWWCLRVCVCVCKDVRPMCGNPVLLTSHTLFSHSYKPLMPQKMLNLLWSGTAESLCARGRGKYGSESQPRPTQLSAPPPSLSLVSSQLGTQPLSRGICPGQIYWADAYHTMALNWLQVLGFLFLLAPS